MALHARKRLHDDCSVLGSNARTIVFYQQIHVSALDVAADRDATGGMLHRILEKRVECTVENGLRHQVPATLQRFQ